MYNFHFDTTQFSRLFPFYLLIDKELKVVSIGRSIEKFCGIKVGDVFSNHFFIPRPLTSFQTIAELISLHNQLVVLQHTSNNQLILRGQFEYTTGSDVILFVGSPWVNSVEQARERNLLLNDFAPHDPLIDLLHVLKARDIGNSDLQELVSTINKQKEELKKINKEAHDIALFPMQNPDPQIRINFEGEVIQNNPAAALLDFFEYDNFTYRNDLFFKLIAQKIDKTNTRWLIEAKSEDRIYSLLCITMEKEGYINIYGTDITEKKKIEDEVKRLSLIASANKNGVIFINTKGQITWANEGFCKLTGFTFNEIVGNTPVELCKGPLTDLEIVSSVQECFYTGRSFSVNLIYYKKDGTWFWGHSDGQPIVNEYGEINGYFGIIEDISLEKTNEEKLKVLSQIAEDNINPVIIADKHGRITWVNKSYIDLTGYTLEESIGKKPGHLLQGSETDRNTKEYLSQKIKNGEPFAAEILNYNKAKQKYWLRLQGQPIKNNKNEITGYFALEEDITKEKESEMRFRTVLKNIGDNVWEHDFRTDKTYFSKSENDFLGYTTTELTDNQKLWWDSVDTQDRYLLEENDRLYKTGKAEFHHLEYRIRHKDGTIRWVLDRGVVIERDNQGKPLKIIGTHVDITNQKTLEVALKKAKDTAEASTKAKENFLANMSHEIRTPMNAILGMSGQLAKTNLDDKQQFYLRTIHGAADNLLVIINDILDLSKIEAGKLSLEKIGFEPKKIIGHAMQVLMHKAEEKGLNLSNSFCDSRLADVLVGDPYRLNQIMLNLISNAVKFTESGTVDIKCEVIKDAPNSQIVRASVIDTGIGMDKKYVDRLFDKFSQEYESVSRKYGGTGLGLSICKELVSLMGGQITVESQQGKGTHVFFELEFEKGTESDLPTTRSTYITNDFLSEKNILVTDDNEMNRLVASTILENYGATVVQANNGKEAVEIMEQQAIDLVLMDVQMPIMNGYDATKLLRKLGYKTPIVALTANAIRGENLKCIDIGMNDYIAKPFKEEEFLKIIAHWLQAELILQEKPIQVLNTVPLVIEYNLENLIQISQGNMGFVKKMIELFIEQGPLTIAEIIDSYQNSQFDKVKKLAHRLKPSIDNLGIQSIKAEIREIEKNAELYGKSDQLLQLITKAKTVIDQVVSQLTEYLKNN